ncbi:MAG: DNA polymerase III subunit delta [Clostridiales bacterium]|nr:DNA polymerase III subunit delta [Clostridiales bacterium]
MKTLKVRIKEEGLKNCYLLEGEDYELYLRAYSMIMKKAGLNLEDFNLVKFDDDSFSMKAVLDAMEVMPMGDNYRVVVLKNIQKVSEADKKMLAEYLKSPVASTILIIFDMHDKFASIKDLTAFVDCKRFEQNMALSVIANEFAKKNKQISAEGAQVLYEYCNGYLTRIVSEVDKLAYYDMNDKLITKKLVESLVAKEDEFVVYELTDALGKKNGDRAIKLIDALKKEQGILGLITNHFRRLFLISISDMSDKELASCLGAKEWAISKQRGQIKNFSKMQLKKIYSLLEKVDYMIKSGEMLQENALYFLVLSILYV